MHSDVHLMKLFNEDFMIFGPQTHMGQCPLEHRRIFIYLYVCPYIHTKIHLKSIHLVPSRATTPLALAKLGLEPQSPDPFLAQKL